MSAAEQTVRYFFSYARADSDFVLRLAKDLRAVGVHLWLDQLDIIGGQRWDSAIEDALARCPRMILVLSPTAIASPTVMDEVSYALEERKLVVPVVLQSCDVPFRLRRVQRVDFTIGYDAALPQLLRALGKEGIVAGLSVRPTDGDEFVDVKQRLGALHAEPRASPQRRRVPPTNLLESPQPEHALANQEQAVGPFHAVLNSDRPHSSDNLAQGSTKKIGQVLSSADETLRSVVTPQPGHDREETARYQVNANSGISPVTTTATSHRARRFYFAGLMALVFVAVLSWQMFDRKEPSPPTIATAPMSPDTLQPAEPVASSLPDPDKSLQASLSAARPSPDLPAEPTRLGRLTVYSILGEPFLGEIEFESENNAEIKVRLGSQREYQMYNASYDPVLTGARVVLAKRADGRAYVRVTTQDSVMRPFLELLVEMESDRGRILRQYTALLDPNRETRRAKQ